MKSLCAISLCHAKHWPMQAWSQSDSLQLFQPSKADQMSPLSSSESAPSITYYPSHMKLAMLTRSSSGHAPSIAADISADLAADVDRRDTSEDSEGGEVSGASPKGGGTTDGHHRPLRKTSSAIGRHRRPPRRSAAPRGTSPAVHISCPPSCGSRFAII